MSIKRALIEASLKRKGFVLKQGDHKFYLFTHNNKVTSIFTKVSHGSKNKTISDSLVSIMARQLKLSTGQFKKLIDCSMRKSDYIVSLKNRNIL